MSSGELVETTSERSEFDTRFLRAGQQTDLRRPFANYREEAILKTILDTWGGSTTGEILDYVYFHTEPMEYGVRNENLDFSKIIQQATSQYRRPSSGKTAAEIKALRNKFAETISARLLQPNFQFTSPEYDEQFRAAIEKLDSGEL